MDTDEIQTRFIRLVMPYLEHDDYLFESFAAYISDVPEPFWTAPASSSGKYHPAYSLGEHGLVRHSAAVMVNAIDIARLWELNDSHDVGMVAFAAAVHDTYKGGDSQTWDTTVKEHPAIAREKILELRSRGDSLPDQSKIACVAYAVSDHMSLWGEPRRTLVREPNKISRVTSVLTVADYIVSRKYFTPANELLSLMRDLGWDDTTEAGEK